jgi:F-type H+-transporting ATPase subunit b
MTFNVWTFLFEILNFVVLAYVLHRLLYKPLRQAIDQRREAATRAQAEADKAREQAGALEREYQVKLAELEQQRQEAVHQAVEQARAERQRLLATTEQVVQQRQEEVRQALERERTEAFRALRGEVIGQAVALTRRLLQEAAGHSLDEQLTLRLIDTLGQLSTDEQAQVRDHWQPADGAVLEAAGDPAQAS